MYLGYPSIAISVVSGQSEIRLKRQFDTNFSGSYRLVAIINDRPAYEASFWY